MNFRETHVQIRTVIPTWLIVEGEVWLSMVPVDHLELEYRVQAIILSVSCWICASINRNYVIASEVLKSHHMTYATARTQGRADTGGVVSGSISSPIILQFLSSKRSFFLH